ncbi:hypothetical protein HN51_004356 [Arachis hypogaea]
MKWLSFLPPKRVAGRCWKGMNYDDVVGENLLEVGWLCVDYCQLIFGKYDRRWKPIVRSMGLECWSYSSLFKNLKQKELSVAGDYRWRFKGVARRY